MSTCALCLHSVRPDDVVEYGDDGTCLCLSCAMVRTGQRVRAPRSLRRQLSDLLARLAPV